MSPRRIIRRAFTLVELLIVVAIIAVLIALLLPALSRARELSKATACLAQQKQCVLGLLSYGSEWNNVIPDDRGNNQPSLQVWFRLLQGQYGGAVYIPPPDTGAFATSKAFICPNYTARNIGTYGMYTSRFGSGTPSQDEAFIRDSIPGTIFYTGFRLNMILRPSDFLLVGDTSISDLDTSTFQRATGSYVWKSYVGTNTGGAQLAGLWANHLNKVNGIFADGHGERLDKDRLFSTSNVNGNAGRRYGISWWKSEDFTINNY